MRKKRLKEIVEKFISLTISVTDDRAQTATKEEFHNGLKILHFELLGVCKKCSHKTCCYKCKGFSDKKGGEEQ